jgi:hypothetical protein
MQETRVKAGGKYFVFINHITQHISYIWCKVHIFIYLFYLDLLNCRRLMYWNVS